MAMVLLWRGPTKASTKTRFDVNPDADVYGAGKLEHGSKMTSSVGNSYNRCFIVEVDKSIR